MVIRIPKGPSRKWRKTHAEDSVVWGDAPRQEPLPPEQETTQVPIADSTERFSVDQNGTHKQGTPRRAIQPSLEHFKRSIKIYDGAPVLSRFFENPNSTASWVHTYFPTVELEVHQLVSIERTKKSDPSAIRKIRREFPFLGAMAMDAEIQNIQKNSAHPIKDLTAEVFSRFLNREPASIKKWAQRKK